jgi:parallel beta-helix repeat protein
MSFYTKAWLSISVVLVTEISTAATYFVAKSGSDSNSCTAAQNLATPKQTIAAGLNCLGTAPGAGAGHTVEVLAGTYTEVIRNNLPMGTSWSQPFTLRARAGNLVTIKASSDANLFLAGIGTPAMYSIVEGFVFDGTNLRGSWIDNATAGNITLNGPTHVRFIRNELINNDYSSGFYTGYSNHLEIINNKVHGGLWKPTGFSHGMYIEGSHNLIEGNELYDLVAFGIQIYSTAGYPSYNVIRRNRVYDFALNRETAAGILLSSGSDNQAYNNIVYNGVGSLGDGGTGIGVTGPNNLVYNNTVYNNTWMGIDTTNATNTMVKNNIVVGNGYAFSPYGLGSGTVFAGNLCGTTSAGCALAGDPKFAAVAGGDFHLLSTSPAIDRGVTLSLVSTDFDGMSRPQGAAYDIGAYEYGGSLPASSPTPTPTLSPTPAPQTANYVGCFTDDANRALPVELASSGATIESCTAAAKSAGLTYAGLQYGGWCFGGNTLGYVQVSENECNMRCTADSSQICGGSWRNSIYRTDLTATPPPTPAPSSDTIAPTVTITSPADGTVVASKSSLLLTANASDNVGVTRVEFYVNGSLKCSDAVAPYSCTLNVVGRNKTYSIKARAYDGAGNVGDSTTISVRAR